MAPIERVEVNTGGAWHQANLIGQPSRQAWQRWELVTRINASAPAVLRARAMDCAGRVQPEHAEWNRLGYGNNSFRKSQSASVTEKEPARPCGRGAISRLTLGSGQGIVAGSD